MPRGAYETRLDPDYWDYIDRINAFFPPEIAGEPLARQRAVYDAMCRAIHPGRPDGVTAEDSHADLPGRRLAVRSYQPRHDDGRAAVVFFHGGGFVFGGLDSHDDTCGDLAAQTGLPVFSVDYRLAPEHPHPASFEDGQAAFDKIAETVRRPLILCGESAGGNLAAAVAHAARGGRHRPVGQMLIYPGLGRGGGRSFAEHAEAPLLTADEVLHYRAIRADGAPPENDPRFEPLSDASFADLPPTVIVTAECDPLSSDGEAYRDRILAAGGTAVWREEPRLTHSFLRARPTVVRARQAFSRIVADILDLADGRPAGSPELRHPAQTGRIAER